MEGRPLSAFRPAVNARGSSVPGGTVGIIVVALLLALVIGWVTSIGSVVLTAVVGAALAALALTGLPRLLFWFSLVGTLVLTGLLELYLPGLYMMRWAFAGAVGLFLVAVAVRQLWAREPSASAIDPLMLSCVAFVLVTITSLIVNWRSAAGAASGFKNYFQGWGFLVGMAMMARWDGLERKLFRVLILIGLLQLPFVLHEFYALAPRRLGVGHGIVAVDIVAGTFGASFTGGGNNAVLALYQIIVSTLLLAIWRNGALPTRWLLLLIPLLLPIFLNESKVSVVYVVLVFLIVFRREVLRRPARFFALSLVLSVVAAGLVVSYLALHQTQYHKTLGPTELIELVVRQNTQEGEKYGTFSLNRTTSLEHWAKEQRRYPWAKTLFGHGPGASRESTVLDTGKTLANAVYPGMGIGVTALSSLLWDVGVVGLATTLAMFASAFLLAGRLARLHAGSPTMAGAFQGLQAATLILTISLVHKNSFMFQLSYQVVVCLIFGYLLYAVRRLRPAAARTAVPVRHFIKPAWT